MIIVSNTRIQGRNEKFMYYQDFKTQAFSEEGLNVEEKLMININDCEPEVYDEASGDPDQIGFFTLESTPPAWTKGDVEDWSKWKKMEVVNPVPSAETTQTKVSQEFKDSISSLFEDSIKTEDDDQPHEEKNAKVYVFGSSKGGTGKTFTACISTYRYAKMHPHQKIALVDFDIIDGQVGISIHRIKPTIRKYYTEYQKGYNDFRTMSQFVVNALQPFPQNVDFYLAPSNNAKIKDDDFWVNVIQNCIENYDVVVFDTGIDYVNINPIAYTYKVADKILLTTTTSIKSINSVSKQLDRLKGNIDSRNEEGETVFTKEDGLSEKLNIIMTQMTPGNEMNKSIYNQMAAKANVVATFGVITDSISAAEYYGTWDVFDNNPKINKYLDQIMKL